MNTYTALSCVFSLFVVYMLVDYKYYALSQDRLKQDVYARHEGPMKRSLKPEFVAKASTLIVTKFRFLTK